MIDSSINMDQQIQRIGQPLQKQQQIYKRQKVLGAGAFGKAYLVKQLKTCNLYVIKQIMLGDLSAMQQQVALKQSLILSSLSHPNIIRFHQVYRTTRCHLNIVMQYADNGDLCQKIKQAKKSSQHFQQNQILDWFTQICLGVKHIHDRKIIHRDLKAQNVFLNKDGVIKIGDFGVSKVMEGTFMKARTVVGSPYYLSPEIIQNKPYSFQTDIWSLGALLYQLCALSPPFTANNLQFLALKIVKGSYGQIPNQYSYELKSLIKSMLNTDASKRPNINKILTSKVMSKRISNFLTESKRLDEFSHTMIHNPHILKQNIQKKPEQKNLLPPPNLKKIQNQMQNKSEIQSSKVQFQFQQNVKSRPFTPVIGQQRKGPNNFFNRKSSQKQIQQTSNKQIKGLNKDLKGLNDLMKIKPTILEQKVVKVQKVVTTPSLFERKQSQHISNGIKLQKPIQKDVLPSSNAFTKKPIQRKVSQHLDKPKVIQEAKKQLEEIVVGKWKKPPRVLSKIQPNQEIMQKLQTRIVQQVKIQDQTNKVLVLNLKKQQKKVQNKVKKSQSTKRIICPTKKTSIIPNKQDKKRPTQCDKKVVKNLMKKQSNGPMEIVSQQVKKKQIQQKKKVDKKSASKKMIKKDSSFTKKPLQKKVQPLSKPSMPKKSIACTLPLQKLSQPPKLSYQQDQSSQQPESHQQMMQQQKCNSDLIDDQQYTNQEFQQYYKDKVYQQDIKEDSLGLSDSCRNRNYQDNNKGNFNRMIDQLEIIQNMIAQANGVIQTLPIFGNNLNQANLLQLSQQGQLMRLADTSLQSISQVQNPSLIPTQLPTSTQTSHNLSLLSNQQHLQTLKMNLQQLFGLDDLIFIHRFVENVMEKEGLDFQERNVQNNIIKLNKNINQTLLKKYFRLIVTVISMEQENNNHLSDQQ